jgi:hypothetical protein
LYFAIARPGCFTRHHYHANPKFIWAPCSSFTFAAAAAIPATDQITAVEFYHADLDHFFISTSPAEIADLDTGVHPGWTRTGYSSGLQDRQRVSGDLARVPILAPVIGTHFYPAKPSECEDVRPNSGIRGHSKRPKSFAPSSSIPTQAFAPRHDAGPAVERSRRRQPSLFRPDRHLPVYGAKGYKPEGDGNPALPVATARLPVVLSFSFPRPTAPTAR